MGLNETKGKRIHLETFDGPKAYPVIGSVLDVLFTDFYEWGERMCKRWGDPVRFWKFGQPIVFISSYKYATQLLSKGIFNGNFHDLDMIYTQGGSGLSTTPGRAKSDHEKGKLRLPAFSRHIVEASIPIFCEETDKFVKKLAKYVDTDNTFNIVDHSMICLFRMVARSGFGDNFVDMDDDNVAIEYMNALHTITKNLSSRILGPYIWLRNDIFYYNFTRDGIETRRALGAINAFALQAIKKRRTFNKLNTSSNDQICYLDILLNLVDNGKIKEGDVVSELNNFLCGTYDGTALTVCWTLLLLALNPLQQQLCFQELSKIFSLHPKNAHHFITAAQTKEMKYLELCLKESLRLFPPEPVCPRSTVEDIQLDDGRIIPGGVDVLFFANLIHRDPQYFPEPDKFLPERHLNGSPSAFLPFSMGLGNSICQVDGMYHAKIVLAHLIMTYQWVAPPELENADDVKTAYLGRLYPKDGIKLMIRSRKTRPLSTKYF